MTKPKLEQGVDYERGFIDGMQKQMQSSVDKAVNRMTQPEQEPVAFICEFYADEGHPFVSFESVTHGTNTPLYTTPPQRKPLRNDQIIQILDRERMKWNKSPPTYEFDLAFVRAIEAAHGIKE